MKHRGLICQSCYSEVTLQTARNTAVQTKAKDATADSDQFMCPFCGSHSLTS
ncbi:small CPxCG-related zinc finger protein [Haloquadratum walsbyi DSM 16790]|jgi:predicted RNA-binding Zn-ribbon protein involved in translation (DUF1610 family)|uniref:Small CPxCG-related zinc finger protein n=1 Tax=Haloquadratum walsbyi (strain DSM 16790 / HBSQ001) TaxID=362976 RepID=J7S5F6_HALWD|nr:small CPxCG-related zinc finger protein [Haloquadratum walsbyi DSM 16790]